MLRDFQNAFVRIVADARLRKHFYRDPGGALAGFVLDAEERAALLGLPHAALERYAQSLVAKRWGQLARTVPLTLRIAPRTGAHYRAWALDHPAHAGESCLSPGVVEALRAHDALREMLADEGEVSYASDLWSFEVLRAAARGDGRVRTLASRFNIVEISQDVERGLLPTDPVNEETEVVLEGARVRWRRRCS